jgi:hypothetical protein
LTDTDPPQSERDTLPNTLSQDPFVTNTPSRRRSLDREVCIREFRLKLK